jgi:hypothetical protein
MSVILTHLFISAAMDAQRMGINIIVRRLINRGKYFFFTDEILIDRLFGAIDHFLI